MASLKELFNIDGLTTQEAKTLAIESQSKEVQEFIRELRRRKATVYTELSKVEVITFDTIITLTSLLLQANLYCRKNHSMLLLKQIFADELVDAIGAFYKAQYEPTIKYLEFIKQLFNVI